MLRNELLAFVVSKLNHTMPPVTLVQLCSQFYTDEEIIAASKLLYDTCAVNDDPRHRKRQGVNRKKATMEDIVSLIERKGGDLKVSFVALDVNNLPAVSFDSLDVSVLLSKIEGNNAEMNLLKASVASMSDTIQMQSEVCRELADTMKVLKQRPINTEMHSTEPTLELPHTARLTPTAPPQECAESTASIVTSASSAASIPTAPPQEIGESTMIFNKCNSLENDGKLISDEEMATAMGAYSDVVRHGQRKVQPVIRVSNKAAAKKEKGKANNAVIGKGVNIGFRAKAKSKFANVFVSRLEPELTKEQLKSYLDKLLHVDCKVEYVKQLEWYSSFHIESECPDPQAFMSCDIWPEGAYVRWWRRQRDPVASNVNNV